MPPKDSITRQLFALSAPIMGANVAEVLMLVVAASLCGRLPGAEADQALTVLAYATQVQFLLMVGMLGLLIGTVALVARAHGAGDRARVNQLLVQSTQLTVIVSIIVGVAGALLARPILLALGASDAVAAPGERYLRVLMIGTPPFFLTLLYAGVFRSVGNTRIPFLCELLAHIVNAVLNYALVLGHLGSPSLGVTGSAVGTVCALILNCVALVIAMRRGAVPDLQLPIAVRKIDWGLAGELFRIGWPAALDSLIPNVGFLLTLGMLGRIDQSAVAAHGIGLRVQSLAYVACFAISEATGAMVGQSLGAGSIERARQILRSSLVLCMATMTALAIPTVIGASSLIGIFDVTAGTTLGSYAIDWMRVLGVALVPTGCNLAFNGLFQGSGATMTSLLITVASSAIQIALSWLLGFPLAIGALGVWLGFPLGAAASGALQLVAYRRGKWATTGVHGDAQSSTGADGGGDIASRR